MDIQPANPVGNAFFAEKKWGLLFIRLNPALSLAYQFRMNHSLIADREIWNQEDAEMDKRA